MLALAGWGLVNETGIVVLVVLVVVVVVVVVLLHVPMYDVLFVVVVDVYAVQYHMNVQSEAEQIVEPIGYNSFVPLPALIFQIM